MSESVGAFTRGLFGEGQKITITRNVKSRVTKKCVSAGLNSLGSILPTIPENFDTANLREAKQTCSFLNCPGPDDPVYGQFSVGDLKYTCIPEDCGVTEYPAVSGVAWLSRATD